MTDALRAARDVNGTSLSPNDSALVLATPRIAVRFSKDANPAYADQLVMLEAKVRKITGPHRAIITVVHSKTEATTLEIDSVMLERIGS
jgi:hypothetical protein